MPSPPSKAPAAEAAPTLEGLRARLGDRPLVLFDGVCHLCDGTVRFLIERDREQRFLFAPLQSAEAQVFLRHFGLAADPLETLVLVRGEDCWVRSTAVLRMLGDLRAPWPLLSVCLLVPRPIRDWLYSAFAARRYRWFGKKDACALPPPGLEQRFLG